MAKFQNWEAAPLNYAGDHFSRYRSLEAIFDEKPVAGYLTCTLYHYKNTSNNTLLGCVTALGKKYKDVTFFIVYSNEKENGLQELFDQADFYPGDLIGIDVEITKISVGREDLRYHNFVEIIPKSKPQLLRENYASVSVHPYSEFGYEKIEEVKITKSGAPMVLKTQIA